MSRSGASPTNANELVFQVQFRTAITGLEADDFVVTGSSNNGTGPGATAQVTNVVGPIEPSAFPVFNVTVSGGDLANFSGQVGLGFAPDAQVTANGQLSTPVVGAVNQSFTLDNTAPRVQSILRQNPGSAQTNATELVFRVGFNEVVSNVAAASFSVTGGSTAGVTGIDPVSGGLAYDVTVSGGNLDSYEGQVGLAFQLGAIPEVEDSVGNPIADADPVASVEQFTVDTAGPTLGNLSRAPGSSAITNEDTVVFRLTFRSAANDVDASDFVVTGGSTATITNVQNVNPFTYDLTVSGGNLGDYDGDVGLAFAANPTITDEIGNELTDTTMPKINDTFTIDNTDPTVTIKASVRSSKGDPFTVTITFNETVTGFTEDDIGVSNGSASEFEGSGSRYSVTITPDDEGDVTISVDADAAKDEAGNANTAAQPLTVSADMTAPTVQILDAPDAFLGLDPFPVRVLFSEPVNGFEDIDLDVDGGAVASFNGAGTEFSALIAPDGDRSVTLSVPAGVAQDDVGNLNEASGVVTVANGIAERTQEVIADFLTSRASHVLSNPADLTGLLTGQGRGGLNARGDDDGAVLNFAARLGVEGSIADQRIVGAFTPDDGGLSEARRYDVWTQVSGAFATNDGADSDYFVGYAGAHYFLTPDLLVGAMVQIDWSEQEDGVATTEGTGWMVGPYLVARTPDRTVSFEARTAWGRSDNTVSPLGTYEDSFDTERWLATAEVSGAFPAGDFTFIPAARVSYFHERQHAYVDGLGADVPAQDVALGELRFGPGLAHDAAMTDTIDVRTELGVAGVWNFASEAGASSAPGQPGDDSLRARLDGGLTFVDRRGPSLVARGFFDGIGADAYHAWGGSVRFIVPIGGP